MQFDPFLQYLATEKRYSPHTTGAYRGDLEQFAAFMQRTYEVGEAGEVTKAMIRSWLADMMAEGYKETSIHRKLSSVNAWFRHLRATGELSTNPARGIPKPKLPGRLPSFIEEKGTRQFYEPLVSDNPGFEELRNQLILQVFYETGMRVSELTELADADIDFSLHQIKVTGKRNKMRLIPVSAAMLANMRHYQSVRDLQFRETKAPNLFLTQKGKKTDRRFVYTIVKRYLSTVTTQHKRSPHVLRHTFATHMLNNGAELNVIKEILGHSSLAATQVYTHNSVEKLRGIHRMAHPRNH